MCVNNNKLADKNAPDGRLERSDDIFQVNQMEAAKTLQVPRRLRTIWRFWIINPDTNRILAEARTHGSPEGQGLPYIEYRTVTHASSPVHTALSSQALTTAPSFAIVK